MNRISTLFGLILLMLLWNTHSSTSALAGTYDESFRCGTDVVMLGDSNYRVLAKCGPPGVKEAVGSNYMYGVQPPAGEFRDMENWTYNRGPTDFIYTLKFQGGSLVEIYRGGRGF